MPTEVIADRYEIRSQLGTGGMANLFVAWDRAQETMVAVKVLAAKRRHTEARYLFHREANSASLLSHDAIIRITDYSGPEEDPAFLVMELIDGEDIDVAIAGRQPIPQDVIFGMVYRVASALAHAHEQGVIHRDIKPENILLAKDGRVILTDFGLAKAFTEPGRLGQGFEAMATNLYGTPEFLSPEQIKTKSAGPKSDVFSLGSTAYTIAAGFSPFVDVTAIQVLSRIVDIKYQPVSQVRKDLSPVYVDLVASMLQSDPEARPTAQEVVITCEGWLREHGDGDVEALIREFLARPRGKKGKTAPRPTPAMPVAQPEPSDPDHASAAEMSFEEAEGLVETLVHLVTNRPWLVFGLAGGMVAAGAALVYFLS